MIKNTKLILLYISISNLVVVILGGVLGYILIGRYSAYQLQSAANLAQIQAGESQANKQLIDMKIEINKLELGFKNSKEILDVQGREIQNKLSQLELDVKGLKDKLDIAGKQLGVSSNIMGLVYDIIPKALLQYDSTESRQIIDDNRIGTKVVHCLSNTGKYPFIVEGYKIFVTKEKVNDDKDIKGKLIEGIDYTLEDLYYFKGFMAQDSKKNYVMMIFTNERTQKQYKKIYVTLFVYFKTHQPIIDKMKIFAKGFLSNKEIKSLSYGQILSSTKIYWKQ